jgi:hypothetical protein
MRTRITVVLAAFAAAGLIGAHVLGYVIALPDAAVRAAILRGTGHGYLSAAGVVAVVAAIFGSFAAAALGFGDVQARALRWRDAALRIAAVQTVAFVVLEIAERAAVNVPPVRMSPRLLLVGIGVQALVACIAALVIVLVCRVAAVVWRALAGTLVRAAYSAYRLVGPTDTTPVPLAFAGGFDSRAPPRSPR